MYNTYHKYTSTGIVLASGYAWKHDKYAKQTFYYWRQTLGRVQSKLRKSGLASNRDTLEKLAPNIFLPLLPSPLTNIKPTISGWLAHSTHTHAERFFNKRIFTTGYVLRLWTISARILDTRKRALNAVGMQRHVRVQQRAPDFSGNM